LKEYSKKSHPKSETICLLNMALTYHPYQKIDAIETVIKQHSDLIKSDVSYPQLCDQIAHHLSNYHVPIQLKPSEQHTLITPTKPVSRHISNVPVDKANYVEQRNLPINPKEKVFDEWGAVLKHQDDVASMIKDKEQKEHKLQQCTYKEELERQIKYRQQLNEDYKKSVHMTEKDEADKILKNTEVLL